MRIVNSSAELLEALDRAKCGGARLTTNWFATPERIDYWVAHSLLSYVEGERALLVFRRDRDFHHLYHIAQDGKALDAVLGTLPASAGVLTADLVGRAADVDTVGEIYLKHGFGNYTTLLRMVRPGGEDKNKAFADLEVMFAEKEDLPAISEFLNRLLDRFADQIPNPEEVRQAESGRNVLLVRRGASIGGLLWFENTGLTSHLRYWYVDDQFRNQGIGARLMKTFFRECSGAKRIILWVVGDNADSIAKYEHYNFRCENLVDRIIINRGGSPT